MKVLVTGGFGYIGARLIKFLSDKGHEISVFSSTIPEKFSEFKNSYETFRGDILAKKDIQEAIGKADAAVHLAALPRDKCKESPLKAFEINGLGTRNVLESAKESGVKKFVYISTFHVYGKQKGKITEETMPFPMHDYALSKLLGEHYCRQFGNGMKCFILRLSNSYGFSPSSSGESLVINDFCRQCANEGRIVLRSKGQQKRDFVALPDVCEAISIVLDAPAEKIRETVFNVGGEKLLSIQDAAKLVAKAHFQIYGKKVQVDFAENPTEEKAIDFEFDISRIKKIGYRPKADMEKEVEEILKAYKGGTVG